MAGMTLAGPAAEAVARNSYLLRFPATLLHYVSPYVFVSESFQIIRRPQAGMGVAIALSVLLVWHTGRRLRASIQEERREERPSAAKIRPPATDWHVTRSASVIRAVRAVFWISLLAPWGILAVGTKNIAFAVTALFVPYGLHLFGKVLFGTHTFLSVHQWKTGGGMELVVTTPASRAHIRSLLEKWSLAEKQLALALTLMNLEMMVVGFFRFPHHAKSIWYLGFFIGIPLLWLDFASLKWLAILHGLRAERSSRGVFLTLGPLLGSALSAGVLFMIHARSSVEKAENALLVWGVLVAMATIAIGCWAFGLVKQRLRTTL